MKKRRKKRRVAFRFYVFLFVVLCGFLYACYLVVGGMFEKTAVITAGNMGNQYHANAVIVRNETLTSAEGLTSITYYADEGEVVYKGNKIAEIYSTGYSQTDMNKLLNIRSQIKAQHKALAASSYTDLQLDRMNTNVLSIAADIRSVARKEATGNLLNLMRQMDTAMANRQSYLKTKYASDQNLSNLYRDESSLLKKIASWTITYIADSDCIVSFYTDGYENSVNSSTYGTLNPSDVRAVIRGAMPEQSTVSRGSDPIFRTVIEDEWYALFLCQDRDWNPVVGETYQMQLTGFDDYVIPAQVVSFTRIGSDLLLRMHVSQSVEPVLNIRTCDASVGDFVTGYSVPINALYTMDNMIGVVVADGGAQTFVGVTVISYPDADTAFVRPTLDGSPLTDGKTILLF